MPIQPHSKKLVETQKSNYEKWYKEGYHTEAYDKCLKLFQRTFLPLIDFKHNEETILDFGCGNTGGMSNIKCKLGVGYDPYVEKYKEYPSQSFDALFTCDVLEHLTYYQLNNDFLDQIHNLWCPKGIFICVSCKPANRKFDNELNAHLIIENAYWWKGVLEGNLSMEYELFYAENNMLREDAIFMFRTREMK